MRVLKFLHLLWQRRRFTFYVPARAFVWVVSHNVRAAWYNAGPPLPRLELTDEEWAAWEEAVSRS